MEINNTSGDIIIDVDQYVEKNADILEKSDTKKTPSLAEVVSSVHVQLETPPKNDEKPRCNENTSEDIINIANDSSPSQPAKVARLLSFLKKKESCKLTETKQQEGTVQEDVQQIYLNALRHKILTRKDHGKSLSSAHVLKKILHREHKDIDTENQDGYEEMFKVCKELVKETNENNMTEIESIAKQEQDIKQLSNQDVSPPDVLNETRKCAKKMMNYILSQRNETKGIKESEPNTNIVQSVNTSRVLIREKSTSEIPLIKEDPLLGQDKMADKVIANHESSSAASEMLLHKDNEEVLNKDKAKKPTVFTLEMIYKSIDDNDASEPVEVDKKENNDSEEDDHDVGFEK